MKTASVTELKNGLSGYLEKVRRGHAVLVTDHHRPVAILDHVSLEQLPPDCLDLAARGWVVPPKESLDVKAFLKMPKAAGGDTLAGAILEDREGR